MEIVIGRSLVALKAAAHAEIDRQAEAERLKYITPGDGQAMAYLEKERQARGYLTNASAEAFAHIHLEAAARGMSAVQVANEIVAMSDQWRLVSAVIESKRLGAKTAVTASSSKAAIDSAVAVDWTIPS